jgi:hypothetical protein
MSISFRSDCPQQYQPPGFRSAKDHSLDLQDWHKLWQLPTEPDITFNAAHHAVKISARNKEYEEQSDSQLQDTIMGKRIHEMQRTSSQRDHGIQSTMPVSAAPGNLTQLSVLEPRNSKKRTYEEAAVEDIPTDASVKQPRAETIIPRGRRKSISNLINVGSLSPATTCTDNEQESGREMSVEQDMQTDLSEDDFT